MKIIAVKVFRLKQLKQLHCDDLHIILYSVILKQGNEQHDVPLLWREH